MPFKSNLFEFFSSARKFDEVKIRKSLAKKGEELKFFQEKCVPLHAIFENIIEKHGI